MKTKLKSLLVGAACAFALLAFTSTSAQADTLAEKLEEAGLGALIGTWVDADTNGETVSVTYAWRIENHAISISVISPNGKSEAMVAVDPESGDVLHISVDDKGSLSKGKWGEEDGVAVLKLKRVTADGDAGEIHISHKIRDNKELVVGMKSPENDEGGEFTLVRKAE